MTKIAKLKLTSAYYPCILYKIDWLAEKILKSYTWNICGFL